MQTRVCEISSPECVQGPLLDALIRNILYFRSVTLTYPKAARLVTGCKHAHEAVIVLGTTAVVAVAMLLATLSRQSALQWPWEAVRALSTAGQFVVSAEVAQHVSQHGAGLVKVPPDMVQILDGYFREAGLTGKTAKLRTRALTDQLKALTRSTNRGGLQSYRTPDTGLGQTAAAAVVPAQVMTKEQLQEEQQMEQELFKMAETFGPEVLEQHKKMREKAAALAAIPLPKTRGGRIKTKVKEALLQHIEVHGLNDLPHEYVRAAFDLPPSETLDNPDRNLEIKKLRPTYTETQALAYALSRLPGCYAASLRIFRELAVRIPHFKPKSLLDFGAGPGTSTWAAQEAWASSLSRVLAIEPSGAMRHLGAQLEAARRFAHDRPPMVQWRSELPPIARSARMRRQQACNDVVVAAYVLSEIIDPRERSDLIRRLWGATSEILVLIEPGTPAGAANIQEARAAILQHEARRAAKLQKRLAQETHSNTDDCNSSSSSDLNLHQKLVSKWYGAHVVAPCPHDGPCPMAVPGREDWCHFATRFQRPAFLQAAKALKGTHVNPADFQDERYSYVVIRRGVRPASVPQVSISTGFRPQPQHFAEFGRYSRRRYDDSSDEADSSDETDRESQEARSNLSRQRLLFGRQSTSAGSVAHQQQHHQFDRWQGAAQPAGQSAFSAVSSSTQQTSYAAAAGDRQAVLLPSELDQLSALIGLGPAVPTTQQHPEQQEGAAGSRDSMGTAAAPATCQTEDQKQQQHSGQDADAVNSNADSSSSRGSDHFKRVNAKLDMYGQGLVNRLIAWEDAGVEWAGTSDSSLPPQAAQQATQQDEQHHQQADSTVGEASAAQQPQAEACSVEQPSDGATAVAVDISSIRDAGSKGSGAVWVQQDIIDDAEELPAAEVDATAAASIRWSRLVRPPRKRGGHVILDVCAARSAPDGSQDCTTGQLERHTVAKSDVKKWMGRAAYEMVHDARWGDLWPDFYNQNPKKQVLQTTE